MPRSLFIIAFFSLLFFSQDLYAETDSRNTRDYRDRYLQHPVAYASKGYVAIGMPMVGEEGRIDDDAGKCGHYGPYYEHFDWYAAGYTSAGAEVWDTVRSIDYLLTLKAPGGKPMVDAARIGMAGLSGGSARTFWVTAADAGITAAVACQGFTTVSNYDTTIKSTCDVHLFYNYYHQSYAEVYGNAAPRALRVIQATEDSLYKNPQPVADAMARIYGVLGKADRFSYVTFSGGMDTPRTWWPRKRNGCRGGCNRRRPRSLQSVTRNGKSSWRIARS